MAAGTPYTSWYGWNTKLPCAGPVVILAAVANRIWEGASHGPPEADDAAALGGREVAGIDHEAERERALEAF